MRRGHGGPPISSRPKLAIVISHPIQYYAPVFRALAAMGSIDPRVFYTWSQTAGTPLYDQGFGIELQWDIPLLEGYAHQFVANTASRPGTHHFTGLRNPTLRREIDAWRPDALLVYGWNSESHLQVLRHYKGRLPVLFRGDSTLLDPRRGWRAALRRTALHWIYRHVDVAIAVGSNNRDYFLWCGLPPERIAFAPHSVDTVRFAAAAEVQEARARELRARLGIGESAVVFLFAGKLQSKKDPALLLEAFARLEADCHLVVAGQGELEAALKARAAAIPRVHFLPFQNQSAMPSLYRLGDVFVLPSRGPGETWGLGMNEAMACGRAIIASSRVGGARDLVQADQTGWIFEAGDGAQLERVLRLASERGRQGLRRLGVAAAALIQHWSTAECARRMSEAVLDTLGHASGAERVR